jgi:hypothetical protein
MAKLTDLPDEVFQMILRYFESNDQYLQSSHLRYGEEIHYRGGIERCPNLAMLARVCRRLSVLAIPLLYQDLYLDMTPSDAFLIEKKLALLSSQTCTALQHLCCRLHPDRTNTFLIYLVNSGGSGNLRSLSMDFHTSKKFPRAAVDLRPLSCLPKLLGVELRFFEHPEAVKLTLPSSPKLPFLKELSITGASTFEQTLGALSLASPTSLTVLNFCYSKLEGLPGSANLWKKTFGHKCLSRVHTLCISMQIGVPQVVLPTGFESAIPAYLPSLKNFKLDCCYLPDNGYTRCLSYISPHITVLSFAPSKLRPQLANLLLSIKEDIRPDARLKAIEIDTGFFTNTWVDRPAEDLIKLAKEARQVAITKGIELRPVDLPSRLESIEVVDDPYGEDDLW